MKKIVIRLTLTTIFFTLIIASSIAQVTVKKVQSTDEVTSSKGFFYSLPQTVFKVEIVYEKVQSLKGPLASYANEYLGISNYITSDNIEYNLINVNLEMDSEPDPNQLYFVQLPTERVKDAKATNFSLSDIGSMSAYNAVPENASTVDQVNHDNTIIFNEGSSEFDYFSQYNKRKKTDTIVRSINIDTVTINRFLFKTSWIDKKASDKAKDAALQIEKIRESRYNLISGYQEVNYGSSIIYMDNKLQQMEDKYRELFLGKTIKTVETKTLYFIPNKNNNSVELMKFSDGKSIVARIVNDNQSEGGNVPNSTINSLYYRIPASAEVVITSGNVNYFSHRYIINQLGSVSIVPIDNGSLVFNPQTGNLKKIIR